MRAIAAAAAVSILVGCTPVGPPSAKDQSVSPAATAAAERAVALCGADEAGDRLVFSGRVLDYQGQPLAKAAVVAYHADRQGLYNPRDSKTRVPRLRGVAVTDDGGRFRFATVRPGAYPDGSEPAHIHVVVTAPAHHPRYVDYWFEGDPLIAGRRGGSARDPNAVIVKPARAVDGAWTFSHDIRLESN